MKQIDPENEVIEQLSDGVVDWLQNVFGYSDEELPENFIMASRGSKRNHRKNLPFCVYFFPMLGLPLGMEEYTFHDEGYGLTAGRMGTLSFFGFGQGSHEMLQRLSLATMPELIPDLLSIENISPVIDLSEFDEVGIETRCSVDFAIMYRITTEEAIIPQQWGDVVVNLEDGTEIEL